MVVDHIAQALPMSVSPHRRVWLLLGVVAASLGLGACSTVSDSARTTLTAITPYRVEVVQGNFVSKEQVELLKVGMTRQQARDVLGTSLLNDVFHKDRWDYVFTIRRQGVDPQQRRLTLYFKGDQLERFDGDPMPSESEFVAQLDNHRRTGKVPPLEASDDELKKFVPPKDKSTQADPAATEPPPPLPAAYPPLEPSR
jgi:outer membrane protein assembly factor BamE